MEDSSAECNLMNCRDQEVSEEKNVSMLPRDWPCNVLGKKMSSFGPGPKSLPKAKEKSFGLNHWQKKFQTSLI